MQKSRFIDSPIVEVLKRVEVGLTIRTASFCAPRGKFGGRDALLMARLKEQKKENRRLRKMSVKEALQAQTALTQAQQASLAFNSDTLRKLTEQQRDAALQAQLQHLAADAVVDEKTVARFPATLRTAAPDKAAAGQSPTTPIKLAPGLNLTAEIHTGKRRVIDFLISPLRQEIETAGRER